MERTVQFRPRDRQDTLSILPVSVSIISLLLTACLSPTSETRRGENPFAHILTPAEMEMDRRPQRSPRVPPFDMQNPAR